MQLIEHPGTKPRHKSRKGVIASLLVIAALAGGGAYYWQTHPAAKPVAREAPTIPVTVTQAASRDVPIYLDALGTVSASKSVAIRAQISGTLQSVNFTEGQEVHKGDTLAVIDSRPLQSPLTQSIAKKAQDQAHLISPQNDLARFTDLAKRDFATHPILDQQQDK